MEMKVENFTIEKGYWGKDAHITIEGTVPAGECLCCMNPEYVYFDSCSENSESVEIGSPKFCGSFSGVCDEPVYINKVIYAKPAVIVFWSDGSKVVAKCHEDDSYSECGGIAVAILKRLYGSEATSSMFREWITEEVYNGSKKCMTLRDVRANRKKKEKAVEEVKVEEKAEEPEVKPVKRGRGRPRKVTK